MQNIPQLHPNPQTNQLIYSLVFVGGILLLRTFIKGMINQSREEDEKYNFLVPASGGCLQKARKDDDGNVSLILAKKIKVSGDTYIFRFAFPDPEWTFGLPIGGHVFFSATLKTKEHPDGELIQRKYTPISEITNQGFIDFVIKIYRKNVAPRFPDGGIMT
jgi:hypothetical protein